MKRERERRKEAWEASGNGGATIGEQFVTCFICYLLQSRGINRSFIFAVISGHYIR